MPVHVIKDSLHSTIEIELLLSLSPAYIASATRTRLVDHLAKQS